MHLLGHNESLKTFVRFFSLAKVVPSFSGVIHSFKAKLPSLEGEKKLFGPDSKQEHSWDMFRIGQTALYLKVDIYSSVDFQNCGKVKK